MRPDYKHKVFYDKRSNYLLKMQVLSNEDPFGRKELILPSKPFVQ
jgi:hypothetical protein